MGVPVFEFSMSTETVYTSTFNFGPTPTEAPVVPTTLSPTEAFSPITVYANEADYPTLDLIRQDVEILVFNANSYPDMIDVNLSNFPSLKSITFEAGSFANAQSLYIHLPALVSVSFGPNTFYGESSTGSLTLYTPLLESAAFDSNALHFVKSIHLRALTATTTFAVYNGALNSVDTIYYMNTYQGYADSFATAIYSSGHAELINIINESATPSA